MSIKAEPHKLMQVIVKDEVKPPTQKPKDMLVGQEIAPNLIMKAVQHKYMWAMTRIMAQLDGSPHSRSKWVARTKRPSKLRR